MKNTIRICLAVLAISIIACKSEKKTETETDGTENAVLNAVQLSAVLDEAKSSSNSYWDSLMLHDDEKMALLKRLMDEISYTDGHDAGALMPLVIRFENVKNSRYTLENFSLDLVDEYYAAQTTLMDETFDLAGGTPNIHQHPLVAELVNDIKAEDEKVPSYCSGYNDEAVEYNTILKQYKDMLGETAYKLTDSVPRFF